MHGCQSCKYQIMRVCGKLQSLVRPSLLSITLACQWSDVSPHNPMQCTPHNALSGFCNLSPLPEALAEFSAASYIVVDAAVRTSVDLVVVDQRERMGLLNGDLTSRPSSIRRNSMDSQQHGAPPTMCCTAPPTMC